MINNQIDPEDNFNELSDNELTSVSGGGVIGDVLVGPVKNFVTDVVEAGKELISGIGDTIDTNSK